MDAPTLLEVDHSSVTIHWKCPNEGINKYELQISEDDGNNWRTIADNINASLCSIKKKVSNRFLLLFLVTNTNLCRISMLMGNISSVSDIRRNLVIGVSFLRHHNP